MKRIFGDEIYIDLPTVFSPKFFEKSCSTITKWGLKFYIKPASNIILTFWQWAVKLLFSNYPILFDYHGGQLISI